MAAANVYDLEKRYREERTATMQIRIHSYENRVACGAITFLLDKSEKTFCGLDQMCLILEEYLDQYPVFDERLEYRFIEESVFGDGWLEEDRLEDSRLENASGEVAVTSQCTLTQKFAIRIYGRANRSLQGELRMDQKKCSFRSGMELMRLMHEWLRIQCETLEKQGSARGTPRRICNI